MGHARGYLAQTLNTTQTLGQSEDVGILAELVGGFLAALNAEAEHSASHAIAVLLQGNLAVRVGVNAGVVDGNDKRRRLEGQGDGGGILGGLAGAQMEGLETAVGEPAIESRRDGSDGVLEEGEALVQGVAVESGSAHQNILIPVSLEINCPRGSHNIQNGR